MNISQSAPNLRARWFMLLSASALIALPSCSTPQPPRDALPQTADSRAPEKLIPPQLSTSGGSYAVVNPNPHNTLRVDCTRHDTDRGSSVISKVDVPPGQSVVIGYGKMSGDRCTYELSGWDKIHSGVKAHVARRPLISSNDEPAPRA